MGNTKTISRLSSPLLVTLATASVLSSLVSTEARPGSARPIRALGEFSNMRFTEEHQYGYAVELWRQGDTLFGFFLASEGLQGDTPTGMLEETKFDPHTGELVFKAKLSVGVVYDQQSDRYVPGRDLFQFRGVLRRNTLTGVLERSDALQPEAPPQREEITLKRTQTELPALKSYDEWQKHAEVILKARGPRW